MRRELELPERHGPREHGHLALLLAADEKDVERRRARGGPWLLAALRRGHLGPLALGPGGADGPTGRRAVQRQALGRGSGPHLLELEELGEGLGGRAAGLVLEHAVGRAVEHLGVARVGAAAVVVGRRRGDARRRAYRRQVVRIREAELAVAERLRGEMAELVGGIAVVWDDVVWPTGGGCIMLYIMM